MFARVPSDWEYIAKERISTRKQFYIFFMSFFYLKNVNQAHLSCSAAAVVAVIITAACCLFLVLSAYLQAHDHVGMKFGKFGKCR